MGINKIKITIETEAPDRVPLEALVASVKKRLELREQDIVSVDVVKEDDHKEATSSDLDPRFKKILKKEEKRWEQDLIQYPNDSYNQRVTRLNNADKVGSMTEQPEYIAVVQDLRRTTMPIEIAELLKLKKGMKVKLKVIKVYK